jgi:hypothetical protein
MPAAKAASSDWLLDVGRPVSLLLDENHSRLLTVMDAVAGTS